MKPKADATACRADTGRDEPSIKYPILSETDLCSRWNLSPKTLQRWRSEGIGPPAWHIGKSVRYLLIAHFAERDRSFRVIVTGGWMLHE